MSAGSAQTLGSALPQGTGVCVINLDSRSDRWESFSEKLLPQLAPLPVHRIAATLGTGLPGFGSAPFFRGRQRDGTWAARGGCTLSHRAALHQAKESCWSHVLILEDDITLSSSPSLGFLAALQEHFSSASPSVCYLGFTDPVPPFRHLANLGPQHSLHQVFGCNTAHAYLVSAAAIDHLLARLPEPANIWKWLTRHRAVDRFYYRNLSPALTVTAISPALIQQTAGFSDIIGKPVCACAENHCTEIPTHQPEPSTYSSALRRQAAAFNRSGRVDCLRGVWKSLRGF